VVKKYEKNEISKHMLSNRPYGDRIKIIWKSILELKV